MKNFVQMGHTLTMIAPYAVTSGQGLLVGSAFGVATADAANGAPVEAVMEGVFTLGKAAGAVTAFARVYWDAAARNVTATASGNTLIGVAALAAAGGDATITVRLNGAF